MRSRSRSAVRRVADGVSPPGGVSSAWMRRETAFVTGVVLVLAVAFAATSDPPPRDYFATAVQVIPTLLIAVAVERKFLLRLHDRGGPFDRKVVAFIGLFVGVSEILGLQALAFDELRRIALGTTLVAQVVLVAAVILPLIAGEPKPTGARTSRAGSPPLQPEPDGVDSSEARPER
ncbi:hypothetical protein [Conexibacter sp. CPCC 206217]|uniref:hypothetical protein n=1 Tax=Conexibacter sp. CPCC 206217 TaxID=3064574 RepID=UPI00271D206A|nr:hypothetical protein [Conexibacter sp. CPCC 206217]MDO8213538.1 hypothetical protein [Conexibacter sp. CPCC 206217]